MNTAFAKIIIKHVPLKIGLSNILPALVESARAIYFASPTCQE